MEQEGAVERLAAEVKAAGHAPLQGIVHSIAFANYRDGFRPFLETGRADFLQATAISAFSLVEVARTFRPILARNGSIVTIGISSLRVTPDNYGYMGPIKAALESAASVVLFHNHPSGDPSPSDDDLALTLRLVQAGSVMGIEVLDHLILANQRYFSFWEAGLMATFRPTGTPAASHCSTRVASARSSAGDSVS